MTLVKRRGEWESITSTVLGHIKLWNLEICLSLRKPGRSVVVKCITRHLGRVLFVVSTLASNIMLQSS